MFDLLIFTQYPNAYAPKRLEIEAQLQGFTLQVIGYDNANINNLPKARFVILREPNISNKLYALRDMLLKHYLTSNSYILNFNSYLKWKVLDKKTQEKEFEIGNIPHIKSENYHNLKFPFIAKAILGSHGDHVYKINNKKELNEVLKKYDEDQLIFQEFLKSGFDLRVIVIDFKVIGIMKRTPRKGEFLSNFSQGGKVEEYRMMNDESRIKQIAIKTAKHFKLNYVGVDIMLGNPPKGEAGGKWKVLEVNRASQFKGFEKAIVVNVAQRLLNWCILQGIHE